MLRVSRCSSALFLVAEEEGCPIGFIKAYTMAHAP